MDNRSKEARSKNMSNIPSKNTKLEESVRKYLFRKGFRYRKNVSSLPGKPDIVLPKYKTVVFVNGCFWHMHKGCPRGRLPKSNVDFWRHKLENNAARDLQHIEQLKEQHWKCITVWECELKKDFEQKMESVCCMIRDNGK